MMNRFMKKIICMMTAAVLAVPVNIAWAKDINTAPQQPSGLLTNELERPLNVENSPYFNWLPQDADQNEIQTAYQILVTDGITGAEVWDSGKVASSEQAYVKYAGSPLKDGYPYRWKVCTWDREDEQSPYSQEAEFATGIGDYNWNAEWISANTSGSNNYWYARTEKETDANKKITKVLAYISCCHDYELNINGKRIGRGQSFDYTDVSQYQAWDITEAVADAPSIAVGITARWYGEGQGRAKGKMGLLGRINVYYEDGSCDAITTDSTWKKSTTPFYGTAKRNAEGDFVEFYDAGKEIMGWTERGFDDTSWGNVTSLGAHPVAPFDSVVAELGHVTEDEVKPVSVKTLSDGTTVADFGVVIPARLSVHFKNGAAGKQVAIQTGYELKNDGKINTSTTSLQSTDMRFYYDQKEGEQTYNTWDHLGFRYLQIPALEGETFTEEDITARIVHAEVPRGRDTTFKSSNETLNEVYELMKRSSIYSAQNSFVDTPTREKGQFLNDSVNISNATMTTSYERTTTKKAIMQFLDSADRYWNSGNDLGRYNAVYPNGDGKRDIPDFTINVPVWVWDYYTRTGDKDLLEYAYSYLRNTADYITRSIPETGAAARLVTKLEGGSSSYEYGIVDWPAVGRYGYDWNGTKSGVRTTVNALSVRAFDTVAKIAEELGKTEDAEIYQTRAERLKQAMNQTLITSNGVYCDGLDAEGNQVGNTAQHSTSYALAFDIAPEDQKSNMAAYVAGMGMKQGPMTAHILVESMFKTGNGAAALDLLTDSKDNGWGRLVDQGYTFTWESWGNASTEAATDSQSHGWGAAAVTQIIDHIIGVGITEAGAKKIRIAPEPGLLDSLESTVATERGPVKVAYSGERADYKLKVSVPVNVEAEVVLPVIGKGAFVESSGAAVNSSFKDGKQVVVLGSGSYEFEYDGIATTKITIDNPEQIPSHAVIGGQNYTLPLEEEVDSNFLDSIEIISDDANYRFAYVNGDILSANMPVLSRLQGDQVNLSAHFKYVAPAMDTAVLKITGEQGKVRVNGMEYELPYEQSFANGQEVVVEPVAVEGMAFERWGNSSLLGSAPIIVMNGDVQTSILYQENGVKHLVSAGKAAAASDSLEREGTWGLARLTDGILEGTGYSSDATYANADVSDIKPYVEIDLDQIQEINQVMLYPRTDAAAIAANKYMFPQDFYVEVSTDGSRYDRVADIVGAADSADPKIVNFEPVQARFVRVTFTKLCADPGSLGSRRLQLAEMEVYSGQTNAVLTEAVTLDKMEEEIALGDTLEITASVQPASVDNKEVEWLLHEAGGGGFGGLSAKAEVKYSGNKATLIPFETGVVDLIARAKDGSGVLAKCRVTIASINNKITVNRVSVGESLLYDLGIQSKTGTLMTAVYDDQNQLLDITYEDISGMQSLQKVVDITDEMTTGKIKFMLWDSVDAMVPLSTVTELKWDASKKDKVWELTKIVAVRTLMRDFGDDYVCNYDGLLIKGSNNDNDYIDPELGFRVNGKSPAGSGAARYIAYTPEQDGTMEITAKREFTNASLSYSTSPELTNPVGIEGLSNNADWETGMIEMKAGQTYYIHFTNSGMAIRSLRFVTK